MMHDENVGMESAMIPKSILMGKNFNPGDEVVLKIKSFKGDMVEVEYAPEPGTEHEMNMDEMNKPEMADKMKSMSSEKMRNKLPKADRESYNA